MTPRNTLVCQKWSEKLSCVSSKTNWIIFLEIFHYIIPFIKCTCFYIVAYVNKYLTKNTGRPIRDIDFIDTLHSCCSTLRDKITKMQRRSEEFQKMACSAIWLYTSDRHLPYEEELAKQFAQ